MNLDDIDEKNIRINDFFDNITEGNIPYSLFKEKYKDINTNDFIVEHEDKILDVLHNMDAKFINKISKYDTFSNSPIIDVSCQIFGIVEINKNTFT